MVGLSYKKNIQDYRNSPAIDMFRKLLQFGFNIKYHDKFIPRITINKKTYNSVEITKKILNNLDGLILATDHSYLKKKFIYSNTKIIFDTRNFFNNYKSKIIKL